ncbi:MAG: peptide deformylase, partial [Actinomycetota bacterium]|nr:peptide deformylase [Actinomycetota bacterium]
VVVRGVDENGAEIELEADDLLARVFQHEIDHLDGVLFLDRLPDGLRREAMRSLREALLGLTPLEPAIVDAPREGAL